MRKRSLILIIIIFLLGCKTLWRKENDDLTPFQGVAAKQLFDDANKALARNQYTTAIKQLETLETSYPYNDNAQTASLRLIYAYYQNEDYAAAAATAERFIHLYPRSKSVDYAYYMKGLANFNQPRGAFTTLLPFDPSWRDPGTQAQAYADFGTLTEQFPNSKYAPDAMQKMIYLRNMFAKRELHIANYYLERKMYVAALKRASYLIKTYPQAPSAKPALVVVQRASKALGLKDSFLDAASVYHATYD